MLASNPTTIIDMYELLPTEGESIVSFEYKGSQLRLNIEYDDESDASIPRSVIVVFCGVVFLNVSSVPGIDMLDVQYAGKHAVRNVVEYTASEAADAWSAHFGWAIRHFHVYFPNENKRCGVFATGCCSES